MAEVRIEKVMEEVVVTKEVPVVHLELSIEEAHFLFDVFGSSIVGCNKRSRRKYCDAIWDKMSRLPEFSSPCKSDDLDGFIDVLDSNDYLE